MGLFDNVGAKPATASTQTATPAAGKAAMPAAAPQPPPQPASIRLGLFKGVDTAPLTRGRIESLRVGTYIVRIEEHGTFVTEHAKRPGAKLLVTVLGYHNMPTDENGRVVIAEGAADAALRAQGPNRIGTQAELTWFTDIHGYFLSDMKRLICTLARVNPDDVNEAMLSQVIDSLDDQWQVKKNPDGSAAHEMGGLIAMFTVTQAVGTKATDQASYGKHTRSKRGDPILRFEADLSVMPVKEELDQLRPLLSDKVWEEHIAPVYATL